MNSEAESQSEIELNNKLEALRDEKNIKLVAIEREYAVKANEISDQHFAMNGSDPKVLAQAQWDALPVEPDVRWEYDDTGPMTCALTGLVLESGDDVLEDPNTGEVILKRALGMPLLEGGEFAP